MSSITSRRFGGVSVDPLAIARPPLTLFEAEREIAKAQRSLATQTELREHIDAQLVAKGRDALGPSQKEIALQLRIAQLQQWVAAQSTMDVAA